ncbi:hypothetical protein JOC59_000988 [Weissella beninensis]|uniref:Bacterial Pleckstrin homology domain-containing protein n=1 Tax=Periweissella beninensis TaxID=504936 RepID=A0ABT0VIW6_9LACO|nr:hypothetical protein [Periweissella beninensis]MBM7544271.1 hypothetical protein [Periweissella beninensis]MCM2437773.1 hypothetical protein [Periweissella beninensis]
MLNIVKINKQNLLVVPQGLSKLAALKNKIVVPIEHVVGAKIEPAILNESKGLRAPGTALPGYYWAGNFRKHGTESFFNINKGNTPVVIQLKNEKYTRLIIGVADPENLVALINNNRETWATDQ